jgi:hypothetical protein
LGAVFIILDTQKHQVVIHARNLDHAMNHVLVAVAPGQLDLATNPWTLEVSVRDRH